LSAFFHVAKNQNLTITIFNYILVTFFDSVWGQICVKAI
jgi:hypothetical protein